MKETLSISTSELHRNRPTRFPLQDFGIDRAEAVRMLQIYGTGSRRADCPFTPRLNRAQPDPSLIRSLLLGPLEGRLGTLCRELGLRGEMHRVIALATDVAQQCLRWPVEPGTRLVSNDGRRHGVVVGVKPAGFLEGWQMPEARNREARGERFVRSAIGQREHLVWTVDPSSETKGISQGRLSDWRVDN